MNVSGILKTVAGNLICYLANQSVRRDLSISSFKQK